MQHGFTPNLLCRLRLESLNTGTAELHRDLCQMYLTQHNAFPVDGVLAPACLFLVGPHGRINLAGTCVAVLLPYMYVSIMCIAEPVCLPVYLAGSLESAGEHNSQCNTCTHCS